MYISRVLVKNVRCFEKLELEFDLSGNTPPWAMIVGDNATGKTTLLRCIAIGLCDESSAASLLKESEEGYNRRRGKKDAEINIMLSDPHEPDKTYEIKTTIERLPVKGPKKDYIERVRQVTNPPKNFPWEKIFTCAYGAGRGTSGTGDVAGYSVINSVYNLFNYSEGLQNPELTIRRMEGDFSKNEVFQILNSLLPETKKLDVAALGITVDGPWGDDMPLRDLADGYKSTFLWVTDFLGWALSHNPSLEKSDQISGIVLVDELEQHLHPKWQRVIVRDLQKQFPKVQFITTTHSPIVASGVGTIDEKIDRNRLIHLKLEEGNRVVKSEVEENLEELDFDQILSSEAFDYIFDVNANTEDILRQASILAAKGDLRSRKENVAYEKIKKEIRQFMFPEGKTPIEREIDRDYYENLIRENERLKKILHGEQK